VLLFIINSKIRGNQEEKEGEQAEEQRQPFDTAKRELRERSGYTS
jgi:hypothetical protein